MYPNDAVNTKLSSHLSATETTWRHHASAGIAPTKSFPVRAPSVMACIRSQAPPRSDAKRIRPRERRVIIGLRLNFVLPLG